MTRTSRLARSRGQTPHGQLTPRRSRETHVPLLLPAWSTAAMDLLMSESYNDDLRRIYKQYSDGWLCLGASVYGVKSCA